MENIKILWADDEIDMLKPQVLFLKNRGYDVITVSNGYDALDEQEAHKDIDIVFLDESMPGMTGLETLAKVKEANPHLPVVMITKNEAEDVMDDAIGSQISDYLIKPVNPNQILLTLKRVLDNRRLVREKTTIDYQQEFREILMTINSGLTYDEWVDTYRKIINWELKLDEANTNAMADILNMQKREANAEFSKFVERNYGDWIKNPDEAPTFSHNLMRRKVLPFVNEDKPTVMLLLDNLRYDQWKIIEPMLTEFFRVDEEDYFYSILPTATQYSRNAIFAGMTPAEIAKYFPREWKNDNDEGGKNLHEETFLASQIKRLIPREIKHTYFKVTNTSHAKTMYDKTLNFLDQDLSVIVYNFIDTLSHARTEMEVIKELAGDERSYRSLTASWFANSHLFESLKKMSERDINLIVTTDHGTIQVRQPSKVVGDRETTTNLRYKVGRNLRYEARDVLAFKKPEAAGLPTPNISSTFIFAKEDKFFLYPNNYTYYNNFYRDTFQHGGISLEEMIVPVIRMSPKR